MYEKEIIIIRTLAMAHEAGEVTKHITQTCPCNIPQYFTAVKMIIFQMKIFDIFLIFAQNIDCGYTLEPPR